MAFGVAEILGATVGATVSIAKKAGLTKPKSENLGYQGTDIKQAYLVAIKNILPRDYGTNTGESSITIKAPLAEKFSMKIESQWSPIVSGNVISTFANAVTQLVAQRSLATKYMSRRIWTGTNPLDFTLNLQFRAIKDADLEVVRPCQELQRMALPYMGDSRLDGLFLHPPGPSPYKEASENFKFFNEGEITYVAIGNLLLMKRVVIKDVTIEFLPQFTKEGKPIAANAAVHFQTYEILTKETLTGTANEGAVYNTNNVTIESVDRRS